MVYLVSRVKIRRFWKTDERGCLPNLHSPLAGFDRSLSTRVEFYMLNLIVMLLLITTGVGSSSQFGFGDHRVWGLPTSFSCHWPLNKFTSHDWLIGVFLENLEWLSFLLESWGFNQDFVFALLTCTCVYLCVAFCKFTLLGDWYFIVSWCLMYWMS